MDDFPAATVRAIADLSRYDAPTEERDIDARTALEQLRVLPLDDRMALAVWLLGDIAKAARLLAKDHNEPPDECEHGYVLPRDCPNAVCADRAIEWAWYVGFHGKEPFVLREADVQAAMRS